MEWEIVQRRFFTCVGEKESGRFLRLEFVRVSCKKLATNCGQTADMASLLNTYRVDRGSSSVVSRQDQLGPMKRERERERERSLSLSMLPPRCSVSRVPKQTDTNAIRILLIERFIRNSFNGLDSVNLNWNRSRFGLREPSRKSAKNLQLVSRVLRRTSVVWQRVITRQIFQLSQMY